MKQKNKSVRLLALCLALVLLCGCSLLKPKPFNDLPDEDLDQAINDLEEALATLTEPTWELQISETEAAPSVEKTESPETETAEPPAPVETTAAQQNGGSQNAQQPAQTEPPAQQRQDLTKSFSTSDWKTINTFLSNFSEIWFPHYDSVSDINEYEMVNFGYLHLKINDSSKVKYGQSFYIVSKADMDNCLTRFFGFTVEAKTRTKTWPDGYVSTIEYHDNGYYFPAADGESYNSFTVVREVYSAGSGTYDVTFDVYELDLETYFDRGITETYYSLTSDEAAARSDLTYSYSGKAKVRDYSSGTFQSFQLISYAPFS